MIMLNFIASLTGNLEFEHHACCAVSSIINNSLVVL